MTASYLILVNYFFEIIFPNGFTSSSKIQCRILIRHSCNEQKSSISDQVRNSEEISDLNQIFLHSLGKYTKFGMVWKSFSKKMHFQRSEMIENGQKYEKFVRLHSNSQKILGRFARGWIIIPQLFCFVWISIFQFTCAVMHQKCDLFN